MHQQPQATGLARHNFYDANQKFPDAGEGNSYASSPPVTVFYPQPTAGFSAASATYSSPSTTGLVNQSMFTAILPFVEANDIYLQINLTKFYNDTSFYAAPPASPFSNPVPSFLCPSNPFREGSRDTSGYGYVDYGPTVYTDIDPTLGLRNAATRMEAPSAAAAARSRPFDGSSKTIAIAEDAGRTDTTTPWLIPIHCWEARRRAVRRSARSGGGANRTAVLAFRAIPWPRRSWESTTTRIPTGGSAATCYWATMVNCGPNDEIFSFHPGGAVVVLPTGTRSS